MKTAVIVGLCLCALAAAVDVGVSRRSRIATAIGLEVRQTPCLRGKKGECIDLNTHQCSVAPLVGFCPGGSNIRCCQGTVAPKAPAPTNSPPPPAGDGGGNDTSGGGTGGGACPTPNAFATRPAGNPGARYDRASRCTGGPSTGARHLLAWARRNYPLGRSMGIYNCRTIRGGTTTSLHSEGRALDYGMNANNPAQLAQGNCLRDFLIANNGQNAINMGVQEVIWNRQIFTTTRAAAGMRPYSGASPHTDHLHIGMNNWGAANFRDPGN